MSDLIAFDITLEVSLPGSSPTVPSTGLAKAKPANAAKMTEILRSCILKMEES
jgi:hypothetical protein